MDDSLDEKFWEDRTGLRVLSVAGFRVQGVWFIWVQCSELAGSGLGYTSVWIGVDGLGFRAVVAGVLGSVRVRQYASC